MSESEFNCKEYKFKRYSNVSGFLAFDKNRMSVGFDEVCSYITSLENKLEKAIEALEFYADKDNWNFKSKGMMNGYNYYYIEFCKKDNKAQETLVDIDKIG